MLNILQLKSGLPLPWLEHHQQENPAPAFLPLILLPGDGGDAVEVEATPLLACSPLLRRTLSPTFCCCSATPVVVLPSTTSVALLHLSQMLSQGSVTIASGALTDLAALLALLEVDIGRTAGVEKKAVNEIQNKPEEPPMTSAFLETRFSSPLQFRRSIVKTELPDDHPPTPPTVPSSQSFHCEATTGPSDRNLSVSSLPAPALVISIPFDRLAPKSVEKIKVATLEPPLTCFFCGLTLPPSSDQDVQLYHQEVCSAKANVEVHLTNPVDILKTNADVEMNSGHHGSSKLKCSDSSCTAEFNSKQALEKHMWVKHGVGKGSKCAECEKRLYGPTGVKNHMRAAHGAPKLKCKVLGCHATFSYYQQRFRHMKNKHSALR